MFTITISYFAESQKRSARWFEKHLRDNGCQVLETVVGTPNDMGATVTHRAMTPVPEAIFKMLEGYASQGIVIPKELRNIYFEECVYFINAVPEDISPADVMALINFSINASCVNRTNISRLRNMYLSDRETPQMGQELNMVTVDAIRSAVNILSQKVMGTDLLLSINKNEEVKWPVH